MALGFEQVRWPELGDALRQQHVTQDALPAGSTPHGQKFAIRATLTGPTGRSAMVVSVWFVANAGCASAIRDRLSWRHAVSFHELDVVVLNTDLPAHGLKRGDLGAIVAVYSANALEVEFVRASGRTKALVTLAPQDLREVADDDLVAVRSADPPLERDA